MVAHKAHACPIPNLAFRCIDSGRLLLLNILGSGTFGTVYRARDRTSPNHHPTFFAVKVLHRSGSTHWREVHHHLRVSSHPNVLQMHVVLNDEDFVYIVLDYCPGGNMFSLITCKRFSGRNDDLIRTLFLQMVDGIASCHAQGIFHRDLKPENILVSEDRTCAYVADFGLATKTRINKRFGAGSTLYMSPECLNADGNAKYYDALRGDIWALGVILVNIISGRAPWRKASRDDDCYALYLEDPEFLRQQVPISTSTNELLRAMMPPDPEDVIELTEVRQRVETIETFYMSEEELMDATDQVRHAWEDYVPCPSLKVLSPSEWTESEDSFDSLEDDSSDSDESASGPGSRTLLYMEEGLLDVSGLGLPGAKKSIESQEPAALPLAASAEEGFFTSLEWLPEEFRNFVASDEETSGTLDDDSFPATPENNMHGMDDARLVAVEEFQGIGPAAIVDVSASLGKDGRDGIPAVRPVVNRFIID